MDLAAFDWDFDNIHHLARHDVTPEEAEAVFLNSPMFVRYQTIQAEARFVEVGHTPAGRVLEIVTTVRGSLVRVVTAYDADKESVRRYFAYIGN